ncbi:MAG: two-component regulator propeller domain-containing protein [Bacteroidales bacterium]
MFKQRMIYRNFLILSFILLCSFSNSQEKQHLYNQYRFKYITVDEGLVNNRVVSIYQDNYGFMWFGTRTGLSKFDGHTIKNYNYYTADSSKKNFNYVRKMLTDKLGTIWVASENGICVYNVISDEFDIVVDDENKVIMTGSCDILEDQHGKLWFNNSNKVINYDPETKKFNYNVFDSKISESLPDAEPIRLMFDKNYNLWLGYREQGLVFIETGKNKITHFLADDQPGSLGENLIERIYQDPGGNIWIGYSNNGFSKYIPEKQQFKTYMPDTDIKESGRVRGLLKDGRGNFWIGTNAGLYLFDEFNEKFAFYAHISHPISRLSHNSIHNLYLNNQEDLWVATHAGGVSYTNLNTSGFVRYDYSPIQSTYFLNDKNVYSIAINQNGNIWIGTEKGGLNYLDRETGKFEWLVHDPYNYNTPLSNNIKDIKVDADNNIWFATYGGGFSYYNTKNKKFTHYLRSEKNPDGFPLNRIYKIYLDPLDDNFLWIGANNGLYLYNTDTKDYVKISPELDGYVNAPEINSQIDALKSFKNKLIVGANKLIVLDLIDKKFEVITQISGVSISSVNFIHIDKKGYIWFDIDNRDIARCDLNFQEIKVLSGKEGLPELKYYEAADDQSGNLWLSTDKGIVQLQNIINNQDTIVARVFTKSDNLQSIEFLYNSKAVSPEGEIFFGGINGFNSFYPEKVITNPYPPRVHITALEVGNKTVRVNEKVYGRILISKPVEETKSIRIHHKIKSFTLRFNGLHFVSPENNRFAYKLEGQDEEWIETNASVRFATYSNLQGGAYTFRLKASNNNGLWSENEVQLNIEVIPAFWKRWWFYTLIIVFTALMAIYFIRQRERQLKIDKQILEAKLKEGEAEINKRKQEIENQKKAVEEKEKAEEINRWTNEGLATFSSILNKEKNDLKALSRLLISQIAKYTGSQQGGIYISENNGDDQTQIKLYGYYAYNEDKLEKVTFLPGEGLIGTSCQQREIIEKDDLPESYAKLNSGLGATVLRYLLIIPLVQDNESVGVIEIISIEKLEQYKIEFIVKLSESIASVISSVKSNNLINEMLVKTQEQSEELHAQEEEMRQTIEEMRATQENFQVREREMHREIELLRGKVNELNNMNKEKKNKLK